MLSLDHVVSLFRVAMTVCSALFLFLINRRYGSQLRHIPGPFFASFSKSWQIWHAIIGDTEKVVLGLHQQHGKVRFRIIKISKLTASWALRANFPRRS